MLREALLKRDDENKPIRIGFVGAGRMGTGAMCQIGLMKGMQLSIIADLDLERALRAYQQAGYAREDILITNKLDDAAEAIARRRPVVTEDALLVTGTPVEVTVDATGSPELGSHLAFKSISDGKHTVMLNVESDVVVGPILHRLAKAAGVVYTVSSGDEPGLIKELYDRYSLLGFEIVAVGKTPSSLAHFDRHSTPDDLAHEAERLNQNARFLTSFRDATKTMIEMACVSNATGLIPDIRGMHGPTGGIYELPKIFRPKEEGGILSRCGVVDYAIPLKHEDGSIDFLRSVTPGVFLVIRIEHEQIKNDLDYLDVIGSEGYYIMHTPYHLVTSEIPLSIAQAALFDAPTIAPQERLVCEVIGAAKRDLQPGETLDGGGGFTVYALNDLAEVAAQDKLVPFGLLEKATVRQPIRRDEVITRDMVELDTSTTLYQLRKLQDTFMVPVAEQSKVAPM